MQTYSAFFTGHYGLPGALRRDYHATAPGVRFGVPTYLVEHIPCDVFSFEVLAVVERHVKSTPGPTEAYTLQWPAIVLAGYR